MATKLLIIGVTELFSYVPPPTLSIDNEFAINPWSNTPAIPAAAAILS